MQDERETVSRVLRGDSEAFRQIVERYQRPISNFVRHLLLDPEDASDLAQEVFLTVFAKLSRFDPACSRLSTWLFTIARNKTINANKKKRPRAISALPEQQSPGEVSDDLVLREMFVKLDVALRSLARPAEACLCIVPDRAVALRRNRADRGHTGGHHQVTGQSSLAETPGIAGDLHEGRQ